jgi:imidazolonepropionase-like amidohydrolase
MKRPLLSLAVAAVVAMGTGVQALAQQREVEPAPDRTRGEGPFERLIIRGVNMIDGAGSPPQGPVDIVIEGDRIVQIRGVGAPGVPIDESRRPGGATREIDAHGMFAMPGFVDIHIHTGGVPKAPQAEYMYKLWMGHGITTSRVVGYGGFEWSLREKARSMRNEITAPRMYACVRPGSGAGWTGGSLNDPETARGWVRWAAEQEIDGAKIDCLKLGAHDPDIMEALIDEAHTFGLGTVAHLGQTGVARMNAIDAARVGLDAVTHFYGIFEALYDDHDVQPWPVDQINNNEEQRFGEVASQWNLIHPQGSKEWNALIDELLELNTILDPTMTAYLAGRDVMRARNADWHAEYTLPSLWDYYQPSRVNHGSYYWDWTTWTELKWKNFYRVWMAFLDDYKDAGGRVTVSSDAGFIYNLFGFSTIEEMELLQEAGFHPLEVIRGATLHGAEAIFEPKGERVQFGILRPGMKADIAIVAENPVQNLKVLYGTGAVRLNDETGSAERVGGILWTIKDGIAYDAKELLADVRRMVEEQKRERGISTLPDVPWAGRN